MVIYTVNKIKLLTKREREVLQATFNHDGNIKIASDVLGMRLSTIQTHLYKNIFNKLQVNSLCGAHRTGLALKLIDLSISIEKAPPLFLSSSPALSSAVSNSDC
jgi:DNA-binding NarL/FixJ family response regulator